VHVTRPSTAFAALVLATSIPAVGAARSPQAPPPAGPQAPAVNADARTLVDFTDRVAKYLQLRKKADDSAPGLKQTADSETIRTAQVGLAARMKTARAGAKQGDIFTPEIAAQLKRLLRPEALNKGTRDSIQDDNPGPVPFKVNEPYPDKQPLSTMPANILQALPKLPEKQDLDYRFMGKHLILHDSRANMIVDYIPNAIP
jgi:hypothetical protein